MTPPLSITTPVAKELTSTHTVTSCSSMHQSPYARSVLHHSSENIQLRRGSCTLPSHPVVTVFALCCINAVATHSQLLTGKCPVNLPHKEKIVWWVITLGSVSSSPPQCHWSLFIPPSCATSVLLLNCSGALHVSPICSWCSFMWDAGCVFINRCIVNIQRGSFIDNLILCNHNDGPHDQGCDVKSEPQIGEAIPFPPWFLLSSMATGTYQCELASRPQHRCNTVTSDPCS